MFWINLLLCSIQEECSWAGSNEEIEKENKEILKLSRKFTTTISRLQRCLFVLASLGISFSAFA